MKPCADSARSQLRLRRTPRSALAEREQLPPAARAPCQSGLVVATSMPVPPHLVLFRLHYAARVAGVTLPVAELLGYDLAVRTGYGLVLTACMPGTSVIPPEPDPVRLRALSPTGMPSRRSPPRRTWADSRCLWPLRAVRTSPVRS